MTALSRDLRFGGTWTRTQTIKNDLIWTLLRGAIAASNLLPGRALGRIAYVLMGGTARANVRRALGVSASEAGRIALASFENLGGHIVDVLRVLRSPIESLASLPITPEALRTIEDAMAEGKGVIFASAHLGPWERVGATLIRSGVPLVTMARESYDPRITRAIDTLRKHTRVPSIHRGSSGAATRIVRSLRSGRALSMLMDLRTRAPSVTVPFFGHPTETVVGPARIAIRTGAPLLVVTVETMHGELVITATRMTHDPDAAALTAALNCEIERRVRTAPEEWLWMHPRW